MVVQGTARQLPLFSDAPDATGEPVNAPGVAVRESSRARRLSIRVFPRGRVEVVVPRRTRAADVEAFVSENRRWIARAVESFACEYDPQSFALPTRIDLPAIGRSYVVAYRQRGGQNAVRARETGATLVLSGATGDVEACTVALRRWLARIAKREFAPRLEALSRRHRLPYSRMQVRAQRSCWGSHSSSGTISLNLCLLFVAPEVVRYLMIHELCHARHMDHSPAFWRLVRQCESSCRRLDRSLGNAWRSVPGWVGIY